MSQKPKKIAFFVPSLNIGGVEKVFLTYAELFAIKGYDVDFVVCKAEGELLYNIPNGVNLVSLNKKKLRNSFFALRKYIRDSNAKSLICGPDIVNILTILANISLPKNKRINLIISQHSVPDKDAEDLGVLGKLIPFGKKNIYKYADKIIAVSKAVAENLKEYRIPENKIYTINNPIDSNYIISKSKINLNINLPEKYIVFVGRLSNVKNIELLINAFDNIKNNDVELVIVGDGPKRYDLESLSKSKKRGNKILFIGAVSNPYPIIKNSILLALPSHSEAFPTVVLEAIILGKTIVHTPNSGCIEILGNDSKNSYCSKSFDNINEYTLLLEKAIDNPIDNMTLMKLAMSFDKDIILSSIEKLI